MSWVAQRRLLATLIFVVLCGHLTAHAAPLDWLRAQQQADGGFVVNETSLATSVQSTAEALRAYRALGVQSEPSFASALAFLNGNAELNTEYLARRIIANTAGGADATTDIFALVGRQNPDGGFGNDLGVPSTVLDTAYALEALSIANYTSGNFVASAVGYLLRNQAPSGGWANGDTPSVFATAQAVRGLIAYRSAFQGVAGALTAAQGFLLAQRGAAVPRESFEIATALLSLAPWISDLALVAEDAQQLQTAQLADGSWAGDPYTTALAVQALEAYRLRQNGAAATTGVISGYVVRAGSREPVVGALVELAERSGTSIVTNADGYFSLSNIPAGQYTVSASRSGYLPASGIAPVTAGQTTLMGALVLAVGDTAGLVNGKIFDAADLKGLSGVVVTLNGGAQYTTATDIGGRFAFPPVQPGTYALMITGSGYDNVSGSATVTAGQTLTIAQGLVRAGGYQDAEPGIVSGSAVDATTGAPIVGALFELGSGLSTVTDSNGHFALSAVPRGDYAATLSATGYVSQRYTVIFSAGAAGNLGALALYAASNDVAPTTLTLDGVVVDGLNGTPITGATIELRETGSIATSDGSGRFQFTDVALKSLSLVASASGYVTNTLALQVASFGTAAVKLQLSPPGGGTATTTLAGSVRDAQTSAPIPNAAVSIPGTALSATTDASGNYRLTGIDLLRFDVAVSAVGYAQATANLQLVAPGDYALNPALQPVAASSFQIVSVEVVQAPHINSTGLFAVRIASVLPAQKSALVIGEVFDASGASVATLSPYAEGTTTPTSLFTFDAAEVKTLTLPWPVDQLSSGSYTVVVRAVEPETINRAMPVGEVLAEHSTTAFIAPAQAIGGAVAVDPPLAQAGTNSPVTLTALIRNAGNVPLASGDYALTVMQPETGAVLYTAVAQIGALEVGANAPAAFGSWVPTAAGNLRVSVRSTDPTIPGEITQQLYVGDKATGTFVVDRTAVTEGTHTVRGRIGMQGVDVRTGTSTDPLFALVKEAVRRGGAYTAPQAVNWHIRNRCLGCHIQTQSAFGLASALGKAEVDSNAALLLYNSIASSQQTNGALYISNPGEAKTQTYLGLWALGASPNKTESFRARYKAAKFLHDNRVESGNVSYWRADHFAGWWYSDVANTALTMGGFGDLLRDAQSVELNELSDFTLAPGISTGSGGMPFDMEVAPDGGLYIVKHNSGSIVRMDPNTNTATTVVTGLTANNARGLAFTPDGSMYASRAQSVLRIQANGSFQTIYNNPTGMLTDVELGPDGFLYVADYFGNRILRLAVSGSVETFASGGLFRNPYGLAFDAAGNLLVANYAGFNVVKIAPDRTTSVFADGLAFRPMWLAATAEGHVFVSSDAGNGLYHITPTGLAQTAARPEPLRGVAVWKGGVWAGNQTTNTLHELRVVALDTALLSDFRVQTSRGARYLLSNHRDNSTDNIVQAMRMIGLAHARQVVTDATLLAEIETAIAYEDALLRSRQRADGGWGRLLNYASDALVTAMVGIALDNTEPSPDDPQIRRIIQYLLNTQAADGSWGNANNGLSTRLAATSFVMAYLPKALDRLGGIDTALHLQLPQNVSLSNPSINPTAAIQMPGGGQEYVWQLLGVTGAGRTVEFDLTLADMQLHEQRSVATRAYLEFANSFTDQKLQTDLSVPVVRVPAGIDLGLATDKTAYLADESVTISATVSNTASLPVSGQVLLSVRAPGGVVDLATLAPIPVDNLAAGAQQAYSTQWSTGATLAGPYEIYGRVLDGAGRVLAEGRSPITINAPEIGVATTITPDKRVYDAWDTVGLEGRVQNLARNAVLAPTRVEITVRSPAGATLFFEARALGELTPGALRDLTYTVAIADAVAGNYTVEFVAKDAFTRTVLSTSTAAFEVRRRDVQAISGTVSVRTPLVYLGDGNACTETAKNISSTTLVAVKLIHQLIAANGGLVIDEHIETVDLPAGGVVRSYFRNVNTSSTGLGDFVCAIKAEIGGEVKTLAFGGFRVVEPPVKIDASLSVGTRGRLLVLLDNDRCHNSDKGDDEHEHHANERAAQRSARGAGEAHDDDHDDDSHDGQPRDCSADPNGPLGAPALPAQRAFLEELLTKAGWSYTITDTAADFTRQFNSGAYHAYALFAERQKLAEAVQKRLREAVFSGHGLLVAGAHDARHLHTRKLNAALGIKTTGIVSGAQGVDLDASAEVTGFLALLDGEHPQRLRTTGAEVLGRYVVNTPPRTNDCDDDEHRPAAASQRTRSGDQNDRDEDDDSDHDRDDCRANLASWTDAVTFNRYGNGGAAFAGQDLLAAATRDGAQALSAQLLAKLLQRVSPSEYPTLVRSVVPLNVTLTNRGIATPTTVSLTLPQGTRLVDAAGARIDGYTLHWDVALAVGEEKRLTLYVRLPDNAGAASFALAVSAPAKANAASSTLTLNVTEPATIAALRERLDTLTALDTEARKKAAQALNRALATADVAQAIAEALKALDAVRHEADAAVVQWRIDLDRWILLAAQYAY